MRYCPIYYYEYQIGNDTAKVEITGGVITGGFNSGSDTSHAGGVDVNGQHAKLNIEGGTICNNTGTSGGGVFYTGTSVYSEFTMSGGTIAGNSAANGGGVYANGYKVEINSTPAAGPRIVGNTAANGGGVYVNGGSFTMNGGAVNMNSSSSGGGVYVYGSGVFTMTGGTVTGNNVTGDDSLGGGVYVNGTFNVSGGANTTGNTKNGTSDPSSGLYISGTYGTDNDVYLFSGRALTIANALTGDIGVIVGTPENGTVVAAGTAGDAPYTLTSADVANLTYDGGAWSIRLNDDNKAILSDETSVGTWEALKTAMQAGGKLALANDITCGNPAAENNYLTVPTGATVVLNLNGHTLNRGLTEAIADGYVIKVEGDLTLSDSSAARTGVVTGGKNAGPGGGVYVTSGSFTMAGGSITGNTAAGDGGGVYMYGGTFHVSGNPVVSGNAIVAEETRTENNVSVHEAIIIDGTLGDGARIGVSMSTPDDFTDGLSGKGTAASFFSDDPAWGVTLATDGEAKLVKLPVVTYNANYGDEPQVVQQLFPYNTAYALRADVFIRRGRTLAAWLDDSDNVYNTDGDVTLTADLMLYADWETNGLAVADIPAQTADGTARIPALTVTDAFTYDALTKGTDYTVEYYLNDSPVTELKAAGTYTVLVTGAGDYAEAVPVNKPFTLNAPQNDNSGNTGGWVPSPAPAAPATQKATPSVTGEGSFTLSNDNPKAGETVTMSAEPAEGWRLLRFQVTDGEKNDVPVEMADAVTGRYVQPKSDVAVQAAFVPDVSAAAASSAVLSPQRITVNGAEYSVEAYNIGGTNFFRLRDLAAMLSGTPAQFNVEYDAARNAVVITKGAAYNGEVGVGFTDMSASAMKSPQAVFIDGAPIPLTAFNIGGYNFFGLRELAVFLGFSVDYDDASNTAIIESK